MSYLGTGRHSAIFGDLLWGNSPLQFIFVDEAGTSEREPVTIVVGLIVNADEQLMFAESAIKEVLGSVPEQFRKGFVFHATSIWSDPKYRAAWAMADRLAFLKAMMELPRRLGIPISLGMVRRTSPFAEAGGMTLSQFHHYQAFSMCLGRADKWIRDHANLKEIATVVAEDVPEMRKFLKLVPKILRDSPIILPPGMVIPTVEEQKKGYITQETEMRVSRIRQSIHFVEKGDDPILQLSDACAFGFRRYFSGEEFGSDFVAAILGSEPVPQDFAGPVSGDTFFRPQN